MGTNYKNQVILSSTSRECKASFNASALSEESHKIENLLPKKEFAFTLAEVLITLGIIGIVAAMTIPTLMANYQKKQTVTKLQKAISIINQAYRLAYDDVGEATAEEARAMGGVEYFDKYWNPYIKVSSLCDKIGCDYNNGGSPWFAPSGKRYPIQLQTDYSRVGFYSLDGYFYLIVVSVGGSKDSETTNSQIFVDINGANKPNIVGKDVFLLTRKSDSEKGGVVVPECSTSTLESINSSCSKNGYGECCAEKIKRAGWQIDDSYPW